MKKFSIIFSFTIIANSSFCQTTEIEQLLLDVEKLAQFKQILRDLKKGYDILVTGYGAVKNISEGNFNLHQTFLDNLLQVSPAVQRYERIKDIIGCQLRIIKEGKQAMKRFKADNNFTPDEIDYILKVVSKLFTESAETLDDLIIVITAGKLRMSDDERLKRIDHIFSKLEDQYDFFKNFANSTSILSLERTKEKQEIELSKKLYGTK
jgi:hypothetical protein